MGDDPEDCRHFVKGILWWKSVGRGSAVICTPIPSPPLPCPLPPRWAPPGGVASPGSAGFQGRRWVLRDPQSSCAQCCKKGGVLGVPLLCTSVCQRGRGLRRGQKAGNSPSWRQASSPAGHWAPDRGTCIVSVDRAQLGLCPHRGQHVPAAHRGRTCRTRLQSKK